MDNSLKFYQKCIKNLLSSYEKFKDENSKVELIFDDERMHYMAIWVGWHQYKRVHQCAIHIDILDDSIIIQCNDTEDLIVQELVKMGIAEDKIHLGFIHPEKLAQQTTIVNPETHKKSDQGVVCG